MSSALRTRLLATGTSYLDAHRQRSATDLAKIYSPTAKHSNYPAPVAPIFPPVSNAAYLEGVKDLFAMWHSFECHEFAPAIIDEEARKVVLFVEGRGESDAGSYRNEYIVVLKCDDEVSEYHEVLNCNDVSQVDKVIGRVD